MRLPMHSRDDITGVVRTLDVDLEDALLALARALGYKFVLNLDLVTAVPVDEDQE